MTTPAGRNKLFNDLACVVADCAINNHQARVSCDEDAFDVAVIALDAHVRSLMVMTTLTFSRNFSPDFGSAHFLFSNGSTITVKISKS